MIKQLKNEFNGVIALSGGIDSTTTLGFAIDKGYRLIAITFNYGQTHIHELNAAHKVADYYRVPIYECNLSIPLLQSELIAASGKAPAGAELPTFVPNRNLIMLAIIAGIAESNGISHVFLGIQKDLYPDTTLKWLKSIEPLFPNIKIHAPLVELEKSEVVKLASKLKVPLELTRSCYASTEIPCLVCRSCLRRAKAFMINGIQDPAMSKDGWETAKHNLDKK